MRTIYKLTLFIFFLQYTAVFAQQIDEKKLLADIQYLSSDELEGRKTLSKGSLMAREYIKSRFKALGLTSQYLDYTQFFNFRNRRDGKLYEKAGNIVGFIPGNESEKIIVVMAHYDHVGKQGNEIFNGADDNASGAAALLSLAEYFSKNRPYHSMMFVALDAEEMGLQGSRALVKDFPFPLTQVILDINMDMISRSDQNELYAVGTYHYPFLKPVLERISQGKLLSLKFGHDIPNSVQEDWTFASDHAIFHEEKIPFIYFGVENHEDYHKPTDTFENIDQQFYIDAVRLILEAVISFDKELAEE